jgi:hypothetical protein
MPVTKPPTFRPTVHLWPADPGALPAVQRFVVKRDRAGDFIRRGYQDPRSLPVDFVLREVLETDLDDAGLLAFVNEWGPLTRPKSEVFDLLPGGRDAWESDFPEAANAELSLDAQRHHLRVLRALARHWLAHTAGDDVCESWESDGHMRPGEVRLAWDWWADYISAGLAGFQMHVVLRVDGESDTRGLGLDYRQPTVYEVAMQQLAVLAAGSDPILHCANDRCGRPFTRQRGRAKYGKGHESGVLYCSNLCARAQAERQRRARRAAERKADSHDQAI